MTLAMPSARRSRRTSVSNWANTASMPEGLARRDRGIDRLIKNAQRRAGGRGAKRRPPGDRERGCLVGEIAGDAGAWEDDDAGWQDFEHAVVALERRRLAVAGPVRLKAIF